MTYALNWLQQALLDAGLKVATVDGWETRGRGDMSPLYGVLCHHTGGVKDGNMPSLKALTDGRPKSGSQAAVAGPLANLALGRDGTFYVIAAGQANHASGSWPGVGSGNAELISIVAENTGQADDSPWPAVQLDAYQRGVAALLKHEGLGLDRCLGNKEFSGGRQKDPTLDMNEFRDAVRAVLAGAVKPPEAIPAAEPPKAAGAAPGRPTLRRGAKGDAVKALQQLLHIKADGTFGGDTEAAVRAFQRRQGAVPDGIVGPRTWAALDALSPAPS